MLYASVNVFRPIANIFIGIKYQIYRAGHVMLPFALTHIVHSAVVLVRMIRYVVVFFITAYLIR